MNKKIKISALLLACLTSTVFAKAYFQAGDVRLGQTVTITKSSGPASYYIDGTEGAIDFLCELTSRDGKPVVASVTGGKNLALNPPKILSSGINGPYNWTLKNLGDTVGNIKVSLIDGEQATVSCKTMDN